MRTQKVAFMHVYKICVNTNIQTLCSCVSFPDPQFYSPPPLDAELLTAHTHTHTHTHARTHARTHAHIHAHTQACTHTRAHTRTRTHAHTLRSLPLSLLRGHLHHGVAVLPCVASMVALPRLHPVPTLALADAAPRPRPPPANSPREQRKLQAYLEKIAKVEGTPLPTEDAGEPTPQEVRPGVSAAATLWRHSKQCRRWPPPFFPFCRCARWSFQRKERRGGVVLAGGLTARPPLVSQEAPKPKRRRSSARKTDKPAAPGINRRNM